MTRTLLAFLAVVGCLVALGAVLLGTVGPTTVTAPADPRDQLGTVERGVDRSVGAEVAAYRAATVQP